MSDGEKYIEIRRINRLLPYADQMETYADVATVGLKESFRRLISSSTYLSHRYNFAFDIRNFIEMFGMRFTKQEYIGIIKFGIGLAFCRQTDTATRTVWADCVEFLLLNAGVYIARDEFQLDWKLFRNAAIETEVTNDVRQCRLGLGNSKLVMRILKHAKRFFPVSCIEEIWNYFKGCIYHVLPGGPYQGMFHNLMMFTPFYSWNFDEISRVWLDDIFYIWYKYPKPEISKEVISLLSSLALAFPGRIDWELHLDRIFNFLTLNLSTENALGGHGRCVMSHIAEILVFSIGPGSSTIDRLRGLFEVCKCIYHPSTGRSSTPAFFFFCSHLLSTLRTRIHWELNACPEITTIYGQPVDWVKLTLEQVDDLVNILLPICLSANIYTNLTGDDLEVTMLSIHNLTALRPRLLLPRLLESLETGFLSPQLPLRVTRPLMALAHATVYLTALDLPADWSDFTAIGYQPTDQTHNYAAETPRMQTPEMRKYIASHLCAMSYPEGRALVARILRCCLTTLDPNHHDRLHYSILVLNTLFLTIPMQDFAIENPSIQSNGTSAEGREKKDAEQNLRQMMQQHFEASEVVKANMGVEDLVVQVYTQVLHMMMIENEAPHFHVVANETVQGAGCARDFSRSLASLGVSLAISASPVPRLRVRLVKILTTAIFQNHWNIANTRLLSSMLFWLISGRRGVVVANEGEQLPESDIALFALRQFLPHFFNLFEELDNENSLTHLSKVEPRFLTLLGVVPAYLCALVPSHLALIKNEFVNPIIDILSRLLTVSIGANGAFSPSTELAQVASECASVLLFQLITFSLNLDDVDVFNSGAHCPPAQSVYLNDPLWTPYVGWREMMGLSHWNYPTLDSFAMAERVVRTLFLPTLTKISAVTEELRVYVSDEVMAAVGGNEKNPPQLSRTSGQFCTSLQRIFLISLTTWVRNIAAGMFEGLKPRLVTHADIEYVRKVCTELEVTRADILSAPLDGPSDNFKLDIPFFDVPAASDGSCLREQIFRVGLEFLDIFAKLSDKYDAHFVDSSVRSSGQSVIGTLYCKKSLEGIVEVVATACTNASLRLWESPSTCIFSLLETNIGSHNGVAFAETPLSFKVNKICGIYGVSRALLAAYANGEAPSLRCGGGGCFGMSYLPLAWLACARKQHANFVRSALQSAAVWPGSEATALFTRCRLPANSQSLRLVEVCARIGLTSNKKGAFKLALKVFKTDAGYYIPGAVCLVAQLIVDTLKKLCGPDFLNSEDSVYRVQSSRRKRAIFILNEFLGDVRFIGEISLINPRLWAEVWVAFAKSALFPSASPCSTFDSSAPPGLSQTQLTERYNDQEEVCHVFKASFGSLRSHYFPLYFPTSFELNAHPQNSPLRRLIMDALSLFKILSGSESNVVRKTPFLLAQTMALRREAYRFLTNELYAQCLEHADTTSNYTTVVSILSCYPFMNDDSDNAAWEAALPKESEGAEFRLTAPPPPPPRTALVDKVLGFLTSQHTSLASAAAGFISSYLRLFLLRSHAFTHILVDPGAVDLPVPCHSSAPDFMVEPYFECLSSEANFTRANHIYNLSQPFFYFESPKTWVDPLYSPAYPTFSGPDGSELTRSGDADEWLKPRSDMDCSLLSPEDVKELRSGLIAVATHVARHEFWSQLSHQFLYFHRCDDKNAEENVWLLIITVAAAFGPQPFLQRLEDFIMALIQPALSEQMDGVAEFVGPTLASYALQALVAGSLDWPREARLALFARVLPRLLVSIEAASQLASTQPTREALHGITFVTPCTSSGAVGGSFSSTFATASALNDGISASDTFVNDRQAYRVLSETWNGGGAANDCNIGGLMTSEQNIDCAGPKIRLPFPIMVFLKMYATRRLQYFIYLPYIWRFFCELASSANEEDTKELFAASEVDYKRGAPSKHCYHRVPPGYGECPVCLGRRLFPLLEQRRALMYQVSLLLMQTFKWDALHLLKHTHVVEGVAWETLACSVSLWVREFAGVTAGVLVSAGFDATLAESPPTLRLYAVDPGTDCLQNFEHLISSPLESKLIEPLAASAASELLADAAVGPKFVMRRFLPLLVRDSLAVLVLKGVVPSEKSFALQNVLLANAAKKLTPVTLELLNCSSRIKWLVSQQIKARLSTLFSVLLSVIDGAFSANPAPGLVGASRDSVFLLIAPLLADIVSSSDFFWSTNRSARKGDGKDELNRRIATALSSFYGNVSIGHTCVELSLTQANRMLDFVEVFLLHNSWKTRIYGLKLVRRLVSCNVCSFWRRDAHGEELRVRLKGHLDEALADSWIEVARDACEATAYLLQLGILKYEEHWFRHLVKESRVELELKSDEKSTEGQWLLRRRHAAVLGLCAFIKAREYDTPDYLPSVITEVAEHAHDPQPIAKSVADTLTAYSHSHHWDRDKFSEAQLETYLSVVSSFNYYV